MEIEERVVHLEPHTKSLIAKIIIINPDIICYILEKRAWFQSQTPMWIDFS